MCWFDAHPFVSRRPTRNHHEAPVPPVTTLQERSTTSGAVESTISTTLSTAEVKSIATAVAQSVLASLQSALLPTPIQNAREVPLVSVGGSVRLMPKCRGQWHQLRRACQVRVLIWRWDVGNL